MSQNEEKNLAGQEPQDEVKATAEKVEAPKNEEAAADMYYAERFFEMDSFNLALNGYGTYPGFLNVIDDYGISKSAKIAVSNLE